MADVLTPKIRPAMDGDAEGLISLIENCWSEYPGCVMDVDGEVPELRCIATSFAARSGAFWVAEREGRIVGSVGVAPSDFETVELFKMYVAASERRRGLASALHDLAERFADELDAACFELWSDTRFIEAHAFYQAKGWRKTGESRELHDLSNTVEWRFEKFLS